MLGQVSIKEQFLTVSLNVTVTVPPPCCPYCGGHTGGRTQVVECTCPVLSVYTSERKKLLIQRIEGMQLTQVIKYTWLLVSLGLEGWGWDTAYYRHPAAMFICTLALLWHCTGAGTLGLGLGHCIEAPCCHVDFHVGFAGLCFGIALGLERQGQGWKTAVNALWLAALHTQCFTRHTTHCMMEIAVLLHRILLSFAQDTCIGSSCTEYSCNLHLNLHHDFINGSLQCTQQHLAFELV